MKNNIIENVVFDTKVTNEFYVIKDKKKIEKNLPFINNDFVFIGTDEGYDFDIIRLEFNNNIYLSFINEYNFQMDFLIINSGAEISKEVIKYLSENVDDEIRRVTLGIYEESLDC